MTKYELLQTAKPILFNTAMVRAILDGRKTQTRRVIKNQRNDVSRCYPTYDNMWKMYFTDQDGIEIFDLVKEPYNLGDILYVRETWQKGYVLDDFDQIVKGTEKYFYAAGPDDVLPHFTYWVDSTTGEHKDRIPWRPSIHMPKEAARIFLRVTDVWVERLQDITPKEAKAEGVGDLYYEDMAYSGKDYGTEYDEEYDYSKEQFAWLWESTIKKSDIERYGWDANPWVFVIEFEIMQAR